MARPPRHHQSSARSVLLTVLGEHVLPSGRPAWSGHTAAGRTSTSALIGNAAPDGVVTVTVTGSQVNAGTGA